MWNEWNETQFFFTLSLTLAWASDTVNNGVRERNAEPWKWRENIQKEGRKRGHTRNRQSSFDTRHHCAVVCYREWARSMWLGNFCLRTSALQFIWPISMSRHRDTLTMEGNFFNAVNNIKWMMMMAWRIWAAYKNRAREEGKSCWK